MSPSLWRDAGIAALLCVTLGALPACGSSRGETRSVSPHASEDDTEDGAEGSDAGSRSQPPGADAGSSSPDPEGSQLPGPEQPPDSPQCDATDDDRNDRMLRPLVDKRVVRLTTQQVLTAIGDLVARELSAPLLEEYVSPIARTVLPLLAPEEGIAFTPETGKRADDIAAATARYVRDNTAAVTGCSTPVTAECATSYLHVLAEKAYRQPLTDSERSSLSSLIADLVESRANPSELARWGVFAILSAPQFLYRRELGTESAEDEPLTAHELAEALSFFVTDGPPDDQLRAVVASGDFESEEEWRYQAARLLDTDRARRNLSDALIAYFRFPRLAEPPLGTVDAELRFSVHSEVSRLLRRTFESGEVNDLLTLDHSYLDERLAALYDVPFDANAAAASDGFLWMRLRPERRGLLTTAAFLTTHPNGETHSVVQRGLLVRSLLECGASIPFGGLTEELPEGKTQRAGAEARLADTRCAECHAQLDPYGLVFEQFDGLGRSRTTDDDGSPVRTDGTLRDGVVLNGIDDLVARLTVNDTFASCLAQHWLTYGFAEPGRHPVDACAVRRIMEDFGQTPRRMTDLLITVASSEAFRWRAGAP